MSLVDTPQEWAPCPIVMFPNSWTILVDGQNYLQLHQSEWEVLAVLVDARLKQPQNPPRFSNHALITKSGWSRADKIFARLAEHPLLVDILNRARIQYRGNGFQRNFGVDPPLTSIVEYSFLR